MVKPVSGAFKGAADWEFMFPLPLGGCVRTDSWHSSCEVSRVTTWAWQMPLTHQALNLTHFNRVAAISHRELNTDIHASRVMITGFGGCYVMLCQHYLFVLISYLVSVRSYIFNQLVVGVWRCLTPWQEQKHIYILTYLQERHHLPKYGLHPFHSLLTLCWGNVCELHNVSLCETMWVTWI